MQASCYKVEDPITLKTKAKLVQSTTKQATFTVNENSVQPDSILRDSIPSRSFVAKEQRFDAHAFADLRRFWWQRMSENRLWGWKNVGVIFNTQKQSEHSENFTSTSSSPLSTLKAITSPMYLFAKHADYEQHIHKTRPWSRTKRATIKKSWSCK